MKEANNNDYRVPPANYCGWGDNIVNVLDSVIAKLELLTMLDSDRIEPCVQTSIAFFVFDLTAQLQYAKHKAEAML